MIYLDTSVVVPLLVSEPKSQDVKTWYSRLDKVPVASDWLLSEFASAISIKLRSGELKESDAKIVNREFEAMAAGGLRLVPVSRAAFREAARLAQHYKQGLRAGDALHLATALELGAGSIATLDVLMATYVKRLKIKVEPI